MAWAGRDVMNVVIYFIVVVSCVSPVLATAAMAAGLEWVEPPFVVGAGLSPFGLLLCCRASRSNVRYARVGIALELVSIGWMVLASIAAWQGTGPVHRLLEAARGA